MKIRQMPTGEFQPEKVFETETFELLKNVKPKPLTGRYVQDEPKT